MEMTIPVAPWACSMYFNWDITLYDFRYQDGNDYNSWWMGSDSFYIDGPCESMSYNSSSYPEFSLVDANGDEVDDETAFSDGDNTVTVSATNLQECSPRSRGGGTLRRIPELLREPDDRRELDLLRLGLHLRRPRVRVRRRHQRQAVRQDGHVLELELNSTYVYDAEGPCDGTEGDALECPFRLYAKHRRLWTLWTTIRSSCRERPGCTGTYGLYRLVPTGTVSSAPNNYWSNWVSGDDSTVDWTFTLSEFECSYSIYSYVRQESQFSGWHYYDYNYIYPETDCIEDAGEIHLDIQDDEGNWTTYDSYNNYVLSPGTTELSWNLTGMLEGYEYEFYWYQAGSDYNSHYEYLTADSDWNRELRLRPNRCLRVQRLLLRLPKADVRVHRQLRAGGELLFHPEEPCYLPFNLMATDDEGNLTVDALAHDFVLQPGDNHLFFDFSHMDNGSEYRLEWYYDDSDGWYGWYYDDIVDTSDDVADVIHFNMSMDSFDCQAYFFARVYNRTDGQNTNMFDRPGTCRAHALKPFAPQVDGSDFGHDDGSDELAVGDNNLTWVFDNLETGVYYRYDWYWST